MRRYRPTPSRIPARVSPSTSFVVTRQEADAVNQPLSFDTSSVTDMSNMFWVRSARALHLMCSWTLPRPCLRHHHSHAFPSPKPAFRPLCMPPWQAARVFNQPLSLDTSSVTYMSGMLVRSARACNPVSTWVFPVHAAFAAVTRAS